MKRIERTAGFLLMIFLCFGCERRPETDKVQRTRDNVINVQDRIVEIDMGELPISNSGTMGILGDYLIILDYKSYGELIHLFNKNSFTHAVSTAFRGQGPGEIANIGYLATNETARSFYVTDHGKQLILEYKLDSVLAHSASYMPQKKMKIDESRFPSEYQYISDTLCIGTIIMPTGNYGFRQALAKWNMQTGEIRDMKYTHPEIERKRICFAVSPEHDLYVEGYRHHDLMTIGRPGSEDLLYNIYGKKWNNETSNALIFYGDIFFCRDKIVALYSSGDDNFPRDKDGKLIPQWNTAFLVFDLNGDYIKTLETGYNIATCCYDKNNHRLIMNMDEEVQFGYLELEGLI